MKNPIDYPYDFSIFIAALTLVLQIAVVFTFKDYDLKNWTHVIVWAVVLVVFIVLKIRDKRKIKNKRRT